jgi:diguanylate cyclase
MATNEAPARRLPPLAEQVVRAESQRRLVRLPWRTYRLRMLGMGLAALPVVAVMSELGTSWPGWAWMVLSCILWPHIAFLVATRSRDPLRAELRNFVVDSMLAGSWVPLMHFNLLPSAVLLTVVSADKINTGVRGLWLRALPAMLLTLVAVGLVTGFRVDYESSTLVVLACLPIMTIHTLAVSASAYRLVRKVQHQNLQLDEMMRRDALTGLDSRGHWLAQAEAVLQRHQEQGEPATLVMLDLDHFKQINDRYGHSAGDDVLRALAACIRQRLGPDEHAGRLGGDEFAIVLGRGQSGAEAFAESLRIAVETVEFARHPALRCSISLGLAPPPDRGLGLREWMEAADRALYRAKREGRNRAAGRDVLRPGPGKD